MGCIVEQVLLEDQKPSELFEALSQVMESGEALETYLELTSNKKKYAKMFGLNKQHEINPKNYTRAAKYKLEGFVNLEEQGEVMDFLTDMIVETLQEDATTYSEYTLGNINTSNLAKDPLALPNLINNVRSKIGVEITQYAKHYTERQKHLMYKSIVDLPSYIGGEKGELNPLGLKLQDIGINIKVGESTVDLDFTDALSDALEVESVGVLSAEEMDMQKERIYDMHILETPTMNSVLPSLKIYLRQLRQVKPGYKYSEMTEQHLKGDQDKIYAVSSLGKFKPANYEKVIGKLIGLMKGVQTMDEMGGKLKRGLKSHPELIPLYEELMAEEPILVPHVGKYSPLAVALFSLAKADYDMVSVVEKDDKTAIVTDANRNNLRSKILSRWSEDILTVQAGTKKNLQTKTESLKKFLSPRTIKLLPGGKIKKTLNKVIDEINAMDNVGLAAAAKQFNLAGFTNMDTGDVRALIELVRDNPRRFHSSKTKPAPFSIVKTMLQKTALEGIYAGVDIFAKDSDAYGENKFIKLMAEATSESKVDIHIGAHLSGRGTIVHAYNIGSEAQDMWRRLYSDRAELEKFQLDPMYADTKLMEILSEDGVDKSQFRVQSFDVLTDNQKAKSGRTYGQLSTYDALTTRAQFYFNSNAQKGYFNVLSPTQGDNGNLTVLRVPKFNYTEGKVAKKVVEGGKIVAEDIKTWIENQVNAELNRIIEAQKVSGIKNYSKSRKGDGNSTRFNLFQTLNSDTNYAKLSGNKLELAKKDLHKKAEAEFIQMLEDDAAYLEKKGVYTKSAKGGFKSNDKYLGRATQAGMESFLANNFIYGYEQMLYYAGDPAFYAEGTQSEQHVNINKRFRLPFTPGVKFAIDSTRVEGNDITNKADEEIDVKEFYSGMPKNFKVKIVKEATVKEELSEVYNILGGGFTKSIELADGQGFGSLDRMIKSKASRGLHTDADIELVTELKKWAEKNSKDGFINEDVVTSDRTLEVLKHFYFKIKPLTEENSTMVPTSLKYSVMPAIPSLFELKTRGENGKVVYRFPGLAAISKELRDPNGADEIVMESAVKVGIRYATDLKNLSTATALVLDNDGLRVPQVTPDKKKAMTRMGSQIRKLIMANHNPNADMLGLKGSVALDLYNSAIASTVSKVANEIVEQYVNENSEIDSNRIVDLILSELEYNPFKDAEYYKEALRTTNDKGESLLPTNYPTIKNTLDASIAADFRNKIAKMKLPGYSAVQVTSMGTAHNKGDISVESDLKFVGISKNGVEITDKAELRKAAKEIKKGNTTEYQITPAEVRVTSQFFTVRLQEIARGKINHTRVNQDLKAYKKGLSDKLSPAAKNFKVKAEKSRLVEKEFKAIYARMLRSVSENGEISIKKVREAGLDEMVVYRIPTQGKNSMLAGRIKEFLPPSSGQAIQVPAGIVEQSGSDFDIDKVYIEMNNFDFENGAFKKHSYTTDIGQENTAGLMTAEDANMSLEENIGRAITDKAKAHAYIMNYHKAVLTHPAYVSELLLPNATETLKKMVNELNPTEQKGTAEGNTVNPNTKLLPSIETQEEFRNNNKSGGDMIGIASISSVMHSMAKHIGVSFVDPIYIKGTHKGEMQPAVLGEIMNLEGTMRISDEIAEIQNAALDNANDPLLGRLNINKFTSGVALLLISAGHGIEFTTKFLNSPILRELADTFPKFERKEKPSSALTKAMRGLKRKYGLKLGKEENFPSKLESMDMNTVNRLSNSTSREDMTLALQLFSALQEKGEGLSRFQSLMNLDSSGTPTTTAGIISKYERMSNIVGTSSWRIENAPNNPSDMKMSRLLDILKKSPGEDKRFGFGVKDSILKVDEALYKKSHLATMETNLLNKPLQVLMESSPVATQQYQYVLHKAQQAMGFFDEFTATKILAAYDTFLAVNDEASYESISTLAGRLRQDHSYMVDSADPNSTANLLKEYRKAKKRERFPENAFTENLSVVTQGGRHFVTFNNTIAKSVTPTTRNEMRRAFEQLMESPIKLENRLAKELADYAMIMYGFSRSINSYLDFLPPIAHQEYMGAEAADSTTVSLPDHFREIQNSPKDETSFNPDTIENFVRMYMENNTSTLPIPIAHIEDMAMERPPKYTKVFKNDRWYLNSWNGMGYDQSSRGIPNLVSEYQAGKSRFISDGNKMDPSQAKGNASTANKQAMKDIGKEGEAFKDVLGNSTVRGYVENILPISGRDVSTVENAQAYLEELKRALESNKETAEDITYISTIYSSAINKSKRTVARNEKKGLVEVPFEDLFLKTLDDSYTQYVEVSNLGILEKIKQC